MARYGSFANAGRPTKSTHAGLEWTSVYSCASATLGGWLKLEVSYSLDQKTTPGWHVSVGGIRLKGKGVYFDSAARLAVKAARQWLARATSDLPTPELVEGSVEPTEVSRG